MPFPPYRAHISQSGDSWFWKEATPLPLILELGEPGSQPSLWKGLTCLNSLRFVELILKSGERWCLDFAIRACLQFEKVGETCSHTKHASWGLAGSQAVREPFSPHTRLSTLRPLWEGQPPTGCTQQAADSRCSLSLPPWKIKLLSVWTRTEGRDLSSSYICCSEPLAFLEKHFYSLQVKTIPQENRGIGKSAAPKLHLFWLCFFSLFYPLSLTSSPLLPV